MQQSSREESHTPTLPVLREQQQDLRSRLREGFETRKELLMWSHAAAAVSLGRLSNGWFQDLLNDRWIVAACLDSQSKRENLVNNPPGPDGALSIRFDLIQEDLSPAFQQALSDVRRRATDYTENQGVSDVDRQRFLGLRPRLHERAVEQHAALRWAFGDGDHDPITSREDAIEWADYVGYACPGTLPRAWVNRVASPVGEWMGPLIEDRSHYLISMLASDVLPAMCQSLRAAAEESSEMPETEPSSGGVPQG
jgi:hypothetical protein